MSRFFEEFSERRATAGLGTALYYKTGDMTKFAFLMALETVPSFASTTESIEINVTTSPVNTKVAGKKTLEDKEVEFFTHRDNFRKLTSLKNKKVDLLRVNPDFTGERAVGTIDFTQNDATSGDPNKGTFKVTLSDYIGLIDNVYDMLQPTAMFVSPIDDVVELDSSQLSKTFVLDIETRPTGATVSATSETSAVATVQVSGKKLTITPVKKGSSIVVVKASMSDYASWETTILVIVK